MRCKDQIPHKKYNVCWFSEVQQKQHLTDKSVEGPNSIICFRVIYFFCVYLMNMQVQESHQRSISYIY